MSITIGNAAIPGNTNIFFDDYFPIYHYGDVPVYLSVVANDELGSIQHLTRRNVDVSTQPYVVSDVDLDGAGHEWHSIDGNIASDFGATAQKQWIIIKAVPARMPHPDGAKMHFVEHAQQRM